MGKYFISWVASFSVCFWLDKAQRKYRLSPHHTYTQAGLLIWSLNITSPSSTTTTTGHRWHRDCKRQPTLVVVCSAASECLIDRSAPCEPRGWIRSLSHCDKHHCWMQNWTRQERIYCYFFNTNLATRQLGNVQSMVFQKILQIDLFLFIPIIFVDRQKGSKVINVYIKGAICNSDTKRLKWVLQSK